MPLIIPECALVVLIGPSGAGKSTFAQRHFRPTEVLSSDACRALVADSETDQAATPEAFEVLHFIAAKRLAAGRLTVIDATNVQPEARRPLLALAREYHCLAVAIVFDLPADICQAQNRRRPDRELRSIGDPPANSAAKALAAWPETGGLSLHLHALVARGRGDGHHRAPAAVEQPSARARPLRYHRRRARLRR